MVIRPKSVTTLSVLGIIMASFCSIGLVLNLIGYALPRPPGSAEEFMMNDAIYAGYTYATTFILLIQSILLWIGSIGSLGLKPIGRICMLSYAWVAGICTSSGTLLHFIYIGPRVTQPAMEMAMGGRRMPSEMSFGLYCGMAIVPLVVLTLVIFIFVFYTKKRVVNAFNGIQDNPGAPFPVYMQPPMPPGMPPPPAPPQYPQNPYQQ